MKGWQTIPDTACYVTMTEPANNPNKPSPADTPTDRPNDDGHKSVVKRQDKIYHADEPEQENIAKEREQREQPVNPIKTPPKD